MPDETSGYNSPNWAVTPEGDVLTVRHSGDLNNLVAIPGDGGDRFRTILSTPGRLLRLDADAGGASSPLGVFSFRTS